MKQTISITYLIIITLFVQDFTFAQTLISGMPSVNSDIYAFEKVGNTVYMGGLFTQVNGTPKTRLASFDATNGMVSSWSPNINSNVVNCIKKSGKQTGGGWLLHSN